MVSCIICICHAAPLECRLTAVYLVVINRYLLIIAPHGRRACPPQGQDQSQTGAPLEIAEGEICSVKISLWHLQFRFVSGVGKVPL